MIEFAHLHTHTDSSILDGIVQPRQMLEAGAKLGIKAIAITDHGSMASHLEAQIEGQSIDGCPKILFGTEQYVVDDSNEKTKGEKRRHIVLIAKDATGYENLIKLNNEAWRRFYYTPRLDFDLIEKYHEGLICSSACVKGVIAYHILNDNYKNAKRTAAKFKEVFGDDFFIEVQMIHIDDETKSLQQRANLQLNRIAKKLKIPMLVTNDVHYLNPEDYRLQEKVLHISRSPDFVFDTHDLWLKTAKQILQARKLYHPDFPRKRLLEAIENALVVSERCNHTIPVGKHHIPKFKYKKHPKYKGEKNKEKFFKNLVESAYQEAIANKKIPKNDKRYKERIKKELHAIFSMDAIDYFLIVEDLIKYMRKHNKLVLIRGSANGSLICYLLEFGYIDPVKHNILFERFISPARVESGLFDVDIDIDMESEDRPFAIEYLKEKYSESKICNVGSYGRLMWRAAIKDMARVEAFEIKAKLERENLSKEERSALEKRLTAFGFKEINEITKLLEKGSKQQGGDISIEESIEKYPRLQEWWEQNQEWIDKVVKPVVGIRKSQSVHPASVVILPSSVDEWIPIRSQPNPKNKSERILCTQWECSHTGREDLRTYGTMALDILGVKTLSIIARTFRDIKENHGVELSMDKIPLDDEKTIRGFKKGETLGVFQLSAPAITQIVKEMKPDCFEDVVNLTAIDRPGALANKAHKQYTERKHGHAAVKHWHKSVRPIMEDTYGIPIYSEHIMLISMAFAGFKSVEAEHLRQLMKSKDRKVFSQFKKKFIRGAKKLHGKKVEQKAKDLWKVLVKFGAYSFPKAHATSYGLISWTTMFLKTNYPAEFIANLLTYADHDEYAEIRAVAQKHYNIKFIMPEINESKASFIAKNGKIIWSLAGIKGIGGAALQEIIDKQPYSSFDDFYTRVNKRNVNKARMESLILAGTFRKFGKPLALLERLHTLRKDDKRKDDNIPPQFYEYTKADWSKLRAEYLGFQTKSYLEIYGKQAEKALVKGERITPLKDWGLVSSNERVTLFGEASNVRVYDTTVKRIMSGQINDIGGSVNFVIWNDMYEKIKRKQPIRDKYIVLLTGTKRRNRGRDDFSLSIGVEGRVKVVAK